MKSKIFGMVVTLVFAFSVVASGAEKGMRSLLIFGDSLSAAYGMAEDDGWVALLELKIQQENRPYRVVNGSVSGETSTGGLERLPSMLRSYNPDIVVLELGGNDGLRGLPLHLLKNNLRQMIALIHQSGAKTLLSGIQIPPNYGPRYATPFYELFYQIAEEDEVAFIPFLIDGIPQHPELMQDDGIHPTPEAQPIILENVWNYLLPMLEGSSTSLMELSD